MAAASFCVVRTRNRQPTPLPTVKKALKTTANTSSRTVLKGDMDTHTCKAGIHGRKHEELHETAALKLDQLPGPIGSQRQLIRSRLLDGVSFVGVGPSGFL